jgi:serine/threonine protein kinase
MAIASQISQAVDTLNTAGILHRDIKPANIMINTDKKIVKLLDLGLGKSIGGDKLELTKPGVVLGTAEYLSPEQANGSISSRSDIFSLAVTLYQFFSWDPQSPFYTGHKISTMMNVLTKELSPLHEAIEKAHEDKKDIPHRDIKECHNLSQTLMKAMIKEPSQRLADVEKIVLMLNKTYDSLISSPSSVNWSLVSPESINRKALQKLGEKYGRDISDEEASLLPSDGIEQRPPSRRKTTRRIQVENTESYSQFDLFLYATIAIVFAAIIVLIYIILNS